MNTERVTLRAPKMEDAESLTGAIRFYMWAGMRPLRQFDIYEKQIPPILAAKQETAGA